MSLLENFKRRISQPRLSLTNLQLRRSNGNSEQNKILEGSKVKIYYITERIIAMGFPVLTQTNNVLSKLKDNKLSQNNLMQNVSNKLEQQLIGNKMAKHLKKFHKDQYMIWNLSEKKYDVSKFDNNVIEFSFPGYPAPPLEQLFILLTAIDNWLKMKKTHVAVLHCHTPNGIQYYTLHYNIIYYYNIYYIII